VADPDQLGPVIRAHSPQVVFHLAAKKHVLFAESAVRLTVLTNVVGALNVLAACRQVEGLEAVALASTDKAVAGRNVMGLTKRIAELLFFSARESGLPAAVVRLCNVVGSSSNVLETYVRRALRGEPLEVYSADLTRYFCSLHEAVDLLKSACLGVSRSAATTLDVGPPMPMVEFASRVAGALEARGHPASTVVLEKLDGAEARHEELWSSTEEVVRPASVPGVARIDTQDRLAVEPGEILRSLRDGVPEPELLDRVREWAGVPRQPTAA
ncbi:MAG TPA: polysaccharide biosynthesis protein, partial [Thermoanaerobaculia bacterium]|nr:polysaccharide biosynthesis protein [Thermoanaerobaculia bacterium]